MMQKHKYMCLPPLPAPPLTFLPSASVLGEMGDLGGEIDAKKDLDGEIHARKNLRVEGRFWMFTCSYML